MPPGGARELKRRDYMDVAIYARVSSDKQDVDLSISAQLRALTRSTLGETGVVSAPAISICSSRE